MPIGHDSTLGTCDPTDIGAAAQFAPRRYLSWETSRVRRLRPPRPWAEAEKLELDALVY